MFFIPSESEAMADQGLFKAPEMLAIVTV